MNFCGRTGSLCIALLIARIAAPAQTTAGIRGRVLDPSGAFVPNASVTISGQSGAVKVAMSDDMGNFSIVGVAPGQYTVRTAAAGFDLFESAVQLQGGQTATLEVHLRVAAERQEVTVSGGPQSQLQVDPAQNASAEVVQGKELDSLSDNPDDLESDLLALAGPAAGPDGGQIYIDGFSNGQLPPKESIREIRVNNNPFSAEFDRPGFGRVEILTKPGADKLHGTAGLELSDSSLNSRNPYSLTKPPTQMRRYDFNVTGPIGKKTSYTLNANHQTTQNTALINADILDEALQPQHLNETVTVPRDSSTLGPRIDYAITPNDTLTVRYIWSPITFDNNGIGGFTLPSRSTSLKYLQQSAQVTETSVIGTSLVNETHFQYYRYHIDQNGESDSPGINVSGAFFGGGAPFSHTYNYYDFYEFTNMTSYTRGRHLLKFGARIRGSLLNSYSTNNYNGTFTFTSIGAYLATEQGLAAGMPFDQIIAGGGGAFQYSVTGGQPFAGVRQVDAGPFVQDDWKVKPNLTLSLGLRYEIQTNAGGGTDWAPRIGLAWGIGSGQKAPKTVLRLGAGIFYNRIDQSLTLQAERQNGITQQYYVVSNPDFFPDAPPLSQLAADRQPQSIQLLDSALRAPMLAQASATLERQLPKNINVSVTYTHTSGSHQLRSRDINAPLPGTYTGPGTGVFPYGNPNPLLLYESSAVFRQDQLTANVNARVNSKFSLTGYFSSSHANSNSDGSGTFPANSYDLSTEWGRAGFDIHYRAQIGGTMTLPFKIEVAPNISMTTAPALNITTGTDLNGDTILTDRPAFATVPADPAEGVIATPWGIFNRDPVGHPQFGTVIVPRNYAHGFGNININGRIGRTWNFGERANAGAGQGSPRFSLNASVQAHNWINHVNPGRPIAILSSPFVGQTLDLQNGQSNANRRVEIDLRFNF